MNSPKRIPRLGWVIAFLAGTTIIGLTWMNFKGTRPERESSLPVLGTVPEFSFTSQNGTTVTREDLLGKIWVADFIFTRCPGPCPLMSSRMKEIQSAIADAGDDVRLVSVSVDPEYDTPEVLSKYGEKYGADPAKWIFLTGAYEAVEKFVVKGMLLPLQKNGEDQPIHSQKFVIVDAEGKIRAYHDMDDPEFMPKVLLDIGNLFREGKKNQ